eukprot:6185765-Pleurochrysis_carterae.AAC.1
MTPELAKDCAILELLYHTTEGPNWQVPLNGTQWLTTEDCCKWDGVGCKTQVGQNRVTSIRMHDTVGLAGTLPPELARLTYLQKLQMRRSDLSGTIPVGLATYLPDMKSLEIGRTRISGTLPADFYAFENLESLYLKRSEVSGTIDAAIGRLEELEFLDISKSKFSGTIPVEFASLTDLETFIIARNYFTGHFPDLLSVSDKMTEKLTECELSEPWDPEEEDDNDFYCPLPNLPPACGKRIYCVPAPSPSPSPPSPPSPPPGTLVPGAQHHSVSPGVIAGSVIGSIVGALLVVACIAGLYTYHQGLTVNKPLVKNMETGSLPDPSAQASTRDTVSINMNKDPKNMEE